MAYDRNMRVLIVDDDRGNAQAVQLLLEKQFEARVDSVGTYSAAKDALGTTEYDLVVLDQGLPDSDGLNLLEEVKGVVNMPPVIILTGQGSEEVASRAFRMGAAGYVIKDKRMSSLLPEEVDRALNARKAEAALRDNERRFRNLYDSSPIAITVHDRHGQLVHANRAMLGMFGTTLKDIKRYNIFADPVLPSDQKESLKEGETVEYEETFDAGDRSEELGIFGLSRSGEISIEATATPIYDKAGGPLTGYMCMVQDVTERKTAEEELRRNADDFKELVDTAAHELRHPATVFKGYSLTLLDQWEELDEETIRESLESIDSAANRLTRLVIQLLDTSRIERGDLGLSISSTDPSTIATRVVEEMRVRGSDNEFLVDIVQSTDIDVDPEKIRETLVILIDNAMKYAPPQSVIEIGGGLEGGEFVYSVTDSGPGIPEEYREKVFERFFQVEDSLHHSLPGLGLGLYIARSIVEAHDGWIRVESGESGGSKFSFGVPVSSS